MKFMRCGKQTGKAPATEAGPRQGIPGSSPGRSIYYDLESPQMSEDESNITDSELVAHMTTTLETVLMYMTNVNSVEPITVAARVIESLKLAGYDERTLDDAALSMLVGAASVQPSGDAENHSTGASQ